MALLLLGKTECPIRGKVINKEDAHYGFASFIANTLDPLYFVNDRVFHQECLYSANYGKKAIIYSELLHLKSGPENRKCIVTGDLITKQDEHIYIGYLTSDEKSNLHQFNFTHINKINLLKWTNRKYCITELTKLLNSNTWREYGSNNKYLLKLINTLDMK